MILGILVEPDVFYFSPQRVVLLYNSGGFPKGSDIKAAVAEASGVSVDKVVFSGGATEFPMSNVNDNMCKKPEGVDSWTEPTFCYTAGSSSTAKDTTSTSGRCADLCGSGAPPEFCANSDSRFADTCTWSIQNECCPRGRRTASTSRRLLNATTSDSCAFDLDLGTKNGQNGQDLGQYFVTIDVEITTTVGRIDDTWDKINEHDLNQAFAKKCLPPVVVTYEPVGTFEAPTAVDIMIIVGVIGGFLFVGGFMCWKCCCDEKGEPEVSPEPEQPNQEPGAETGQTPAEHNAANTSSQPGLTSNVQPSATGDSSGSLPPRFCAQCGSPDVAGKFCGACGAAVVKT